MVIPPPARHPILYYLWFEWSVARALRKVQPDVFLSPDGYLSLRTDVPQVPVIHDLNFHHHPEYFSTVNRLHYLHYFPRYARKAQRIATISEFSKADIVERYGIDPSRIDVTYNGAPQDLLHLTDVQKRDVRLEITGGRPYIVFIGGLYPRKNIIQQLLAFDQFKEKTGSNACFVVIGAANATSAPIFDTLSTLRWKQDVLMLGRVDPREKVDRILAASEALMFVSTFEGFGLPLLEAMRCGVPTITGNISAMPEIADGCALLVPPDNTAEIASAIERVLTNRELRSTLIQNGYQRLPMFTWEKAASTLWDTVQAVHASNH